jgi:serine/threonine-protein kinase
VPDPDPLVGDVLGHYRVLGRLGAGGMGVVYRAEDLRLGRPVAIKLLPGGDDSAEPTAVDRLYREARAASALSHPNICVVFDLGAEKGRTFIVMELLEGRTLREIIAARTLSVADVVEMSTQIVDALEAAHAKNIIHRDIKPGNVFITSRRQAKVLDFGLAKVLDADHDPFLMRTGDVATQSGAVLGTVAYMSTEQVKGEKLDRRSDIFSFGAVLYEMLTGHQAFGASTTALVFDAILHHDPVPPSALNAQVPRLLDDVVAKSLAKDRGHRFQTARELLAALYAVKAGSDTGIRASRSSTSTGRAPSALGSRQPASRSGEISRSRTITSLAVLPFQNMAGDAGEDADYLSDGLTESIINKLSPIAGLRVIPRLTVFRYKGKAIDPVAAATEMKARAVVVGRVLLRDKRLIVNVELVDAKRNAQLWGEQYNRALSDVFAVQESVATEVSRSLQVTLSGDEQARIARRDTDDTGAYQAYLKGRFYWNKRSPEGLSLAVEHFQSAIESDPQFARAYTGMADSYNILGYYSHRRPAEVFPRAKAAATQALRIDPSLAEAHASLGYTRTFFDRDWAGAEAAFQDAIRLKPEYASAHQWYGWLLMATGRHDEMLAAMRRAQTLDPLSLIINAHLGYSLLLVGKHDEALQQLRSTLDLDDGFAVAHQFLGMLYLKTGSLDRAVEELEDALRLSSHRIAFGVLGHAAALAGRRERARDLLAMLQAIREERFVSPLEQALIHGGLLEVDAAFVALEQAVEAQVSDLVRLPLLPWPAAVRQDARFAVILERLGVSSAGC